MKNRILLSIAMTFAFSMAEAQIFNSVSSQKLTANETPDVKVAGISSDGNMVLTTSSTNQGLDRISISSGQKLNLSKEPGAGFHPTVSSDGKTVQFRVVSFNDMHQRLTALKRVNCDGTGLVTLQQPARKVRDAAIAESRPMVYIEDMQLMLRKDGTEKVLSPNGTDCDYLWPSLSPDGKHILYFVSDEGCYVCDINGKNVKFVNWNCRAPQWYDNSTIVGMNDQDNGEFLVSSQIVAYTLDGKKQELTKPESLTMYPHCSSQAGRIVCSSAKGEVVLLNVKKGGNQ